MQQVFRQLPTAESPNGTPGHYRQTYTQLFKHLDPGMPVSHCHQSMYNKYVRHLQSILNNEVIFYATDTGYAPMVGMTVAVAVAIEEASG
jgi:hypothetical protein